jgi:3-methyladenine DNA glycosylase Tag
MYEVSSKDSSTQASLDKIEYMQWKSPEAFSDYVWKFVIKPEDDNSFLDENVSLQWVERLAKRLNKTLTYRELRNKFPFIKK